MPIPNLSVSQVQDILQNASNIHLHDSGAQKIVFSANINNEKYAIKFMRPDMPSSEESDEEYLDDVTARAQREVETMQQCSTQYLVKMGPIGLRTVEVNGESLIYFSEEFIEGKNLKQYYQETGNFSNQELVKLALHISIAIDKIWQFSKIHRDIKPGNIMRRDSNGVFILLDMGLVFDLQDESLSLGPVGTPRYFSPEQMNFSNRRTVMNFRSDLFSLGIVLYEMATGKHPFAPGTSTTTWDVLNNILNMNPEPPITHCPDLSPKLNEIILRLLAKRPALRYRSINIFQNAFQEVNPNGGST